jgi:hypothetical protein
MNQSRWSDVSSARLEQDVFVAAYAVRKLLEANKLSTSLVDKMVEVTTYPRKSQQMDHLNWHRLDEHFDLDSGGPRTIRLRDLCNQIIHSYVFMERFDGKPPRLAGLFFSSDVQRQQGVHEIELARLVKLLRRIAEDSPDHAVSVRDPKTWEWIVYQWDSNHEDPDRKRIDAIAKRQAAAMDAYHADRVE